MIELWHSWPQSDSPPSYHCSSSTSFNVQNSFCDGTKPAMFFIVPCLSPVSCLWWLSGATRYWNSAHAFPPPAITNVFKCSSAWHMSRSFLLLFPYLSNTRTLLGEKGGRAFTEHLGKFIEHHEAHYSESLQLPIQHITDLQSTTENAQFFIFDSKHVSK